MSSHKLGGVGINCYIVRHIKLLSLHKNKADVGLLLQFLFHGGFPPKAQGKAIPLRDAERSISKHHAHIFASQKFIVGLHHDQSLFGIFSEKA